MTIGFDRPTGAAADVKELEYVSALHQTDLKGGLRKDGSITGKENNRKLEDTDDCSKNKCIDLHCV